jgi:hypothetical protein
MEFFFVDPNIQRLAPAETRLVDLRADPYPDGERLRVALELTPFQQRPNIELSLSGSSGGPAASASIVEPVAWKLEVTLHVRTPDPSGSYQLLASLSYPDLGEVDQRAIDVAIPAAPKKNDTILRD